MSVQKYIAPVFGIMSAIGGGYAGYEFTNDRPNEQVVLADLQNESWAIAEELIGNPDLDECQKPVIYSWLFENHNESFPDSASDIEDRLREVCGDNPTHKNIGEVSIAGFKADKKVRNEMDDAREENFDQVFAPVMGALVGGFVGVAIGAYVGYSVEDRQYRK